MLAINTVQHLYYTIEDQEVTIRPMRPDDEEMEVAFFNNLSPTTKYFRFMGGIRELSPAMVSQLCDIDGKCAMVFIATITDTKGEKQIGVGRYTRGIYETDSESGVEMALTVADDWHHKGIDKLIMKPLIQYAKNNGIKKLYTSEFAENAAMRHIAKEFGMTAKADPLDAQLISYSLEI
ncbi:MAG: GNAT superfamily N-acetyltransferase [Glaciecola sp.]|jgi:GNAT superfamily N-acetyltransferase